MASSKNWTKTRSTVKHLKIAPTSAYNKLSERDIRDTLHKRKISGSIRSENVREKLRYKVII
jgi:hypothetical protein